MRSVYSKLDGSFAITSDVHQKDACLVKVGIVVCCCLHTFLESGNVNIDDDVQANLDKEL